MSKINKKIGFIFSIALISLFVTSLEAREYDRDRNVNNEQVGIISSVERTSVDEYEVAIDNNDVIEVEMEEGEVIVGDDVYIEGDIISPFFEE